MRASRLVGLDQKRGLNPRPVPSVYPAYHVFNLSELATPNFYLGHWGQMRTVSLLHMGQSGSGTSARSFSGSVR